MVSLFYQKATTQKHIIGKSCLGRNIYAVKIGDGRPVCIAQYGIHGREWITSMLALVHAEIGVFRGSLWLIPLTNPDGAMLSQNGLQSVADKAVQKRLLALNKSDDFSLWKANARGVDLNVNFDAEWGKGEKNVRTAGAENYIGKRPFSEKESKVLRKFTLQISPDYTVSYHTKGEEIFWRFPYSTHTCPYEKRLADSLSKTTGYPLKVAKNSVGGYKDWCIQTLKIPAFTVEVGKDTFGHPLNERALPDIIEKNKNALYMLSKEFYCDETNNT